MQKNTDRIKRCVLSQWARRGCAILWIGFCVWSIRQDALAQEATADTLLAAAQFYFQSGDYSAAVHTCNRLLAAYPESPLNDQARYWLGRSLLAKQQPRLARLAFQQLLAVFPASRLAMQTRLGIADTFRAEKKYIEAAKAYLTLEMDRAAGDSLRVILFRAGQCLEADGKMLEARHVYNRLIARFPDSGEAEAVRKWATDGNAESR